MNFWSTNAQPYYASRSWSYLGKLYVAGGFITNIASPTTTLYVYDPTTDNWATLAPLTDYAGNVMTPTTSTFTTGAAFDFTSPTVVSAYPANGAIGVVATTVLSVIFSEAMDPVLMTSSQVYLQTHNTHTIVPVTLSISADFKTVYLTPTAPLSPLTIYDVAIYGNNWWPYDIAGNSFSLSGYVTYNSGYVYTTFTTRQRPLCPPASARAAVVVGDVVMSNNEPVTCMVRIRIWRMCRLSMKLRLCSGCIRKPSS